MVVGVMIMVIVKTLEMVVIIMVMINDYSDW